MGADITSPAVDYYRTGQKLGKERKCFIIKTIS